MSTRVMLGRKIAKLGKLPVVVLPLQDYERMQEELEMFRSRTLSRRVRKAREEATKGETLTLTQVKKRLKLG